MFNARQAAALTPGEHLTIEEIRDRLARTEGVPVQVKRPTYSV